jgi:hypothetical protein
MSIEIETKGNNIYIISQWKKNKIKIELNVCFWKTQVKFDYTTLNQKMGPKKNCTFFRNKQGDE